MDELPELPNSQFCAWMKDGKACNAFPWGVGDREKWDHDRYWETKGYDRAPLFTADQMRAYARAAVLADRATRSTLSERAAELHGQIKSRTVENVLHFLTPQQMAQEIVRLDAVLAGRQQNITMGRLPPSPLTHCAASGRNSDGDCYHSQCPQNRDGEPDKTGRSCPLPGWGDDE